MSRKIITIVATLCYLALPFLAKQEALRTVFFTVEFLGGMCLGSLLARSFYDEA